MAKTWRVSAATITIGNKSIDEYATSRACDRDDFVKFKVDKTFIEDEGLSKCSPSDPQTETGTWDINKDETKLLVPMVIGSTDLYDIVELSTSTLHIRYVDTSSTPNETEDITYTTF